MALPRRLFVDTSYVIGLLIPGDQHHAAARTAARAVLRTRPAQYTTRAVLLEVGDALAKPATRASASLVLRSLESDPGVQVVELSDTRYRQARALYDARADQAWGLTDCLSFVVMRELGLAAALTADRHFEQAGYRALLREVRNDRT